MPQRQPVRASIINAQLGSLPKTKNAIRNVDAPAASHVSQGRAAAAFVVR